jgi:hypothetical protein
MVYILTVHRLTPWYSRQLQHAYLHIRCVSRFIPIWSHIPFIVDHLLVHEKHAEDESMAMQVGRLVLFLGSTPTRHTTLNQNNSIKLYTYVQRRIETTTASRWFIWNDTLTYVRCSTPIAQKLCYMNYKLLWLVDRGVCHNIVLWFVACYLIIIWNRITTKDKSIFLKEIITAVVVIVWFSQVSKQESVSDRTTSLHLPKLKVWVCHGNEN